VSARCKALFCGRSLAENAGSNPAGGMNICTLLSVLCSQVGVSATGQSYVQRSPTECGGSECDHEASTMRRS
jgi:hypothetical protein